LPVQVPAGWEKRARGGQGEIGPGDRATIQEAAGITRGAGAIRLVLDFAGRFC